MSKGPSIGHPYFLAAVGVLFVLDTPWSMAQWSWDVLPDMAGALLMLVAAIKLGGASRLVSSIRGMAAALLFIDALLFFGVVGARSSIGYVALDLASVIIWVALVWALCEIPIRHAGDRQLVTYLVLARGLFAAQGVANWLVTLILLMARGELQSPVTFTWRFLTAAILVFVFWVFVMVMMRFDPARPRDLSKQARLTRPYG